MTEYVDSVGDIANLLVRAVELNQKEGLDLYSACDAATVEIDYDRRAGDMLYLLLANSWDETLGWVHDSVRIPCNEYRYVSETENKRKKPFKYLFNGKEYGQGRLVWAVINYAAYKFKYTYSEMKEQFPDELHGALSTIDRISNIKDRTRYFIKEEDIITLNDGVEIVVCNQWYCGKKPNTPRFIDHAIKLGYEIKEL